MTVRVQFFAQLRDATGVSEATLDLVEHATMADLLAAAYIRWPRLHKWDRSLLFGSGVEFVSRQHRLSPNEQIAVMPPVQGG